MKYGFWYYQPVIKTYQFWRPLSPPAVIAPELPKPTPYFNPVFTTKHMDTLTAVDESAFVNLVQQHYLRAVDTGNIYSPTLENIMPYFRGHDAPCFYTSNGNGLQPTGVITSRPLLVTMGNAATKKDMLVYYVDFLCVDRLHRRKGLAAQLIQTHEYWQRHKNPRIAVSLFKHETDVLRGVVPLTAYTTYGFTIASILERINNQPPNAIVAPPYKMESIKESNMPGLYAFIQECRKQLQYKVFISTAIANIMELIKTRNIYIHVITDMDTKNVVAAYFYKNTCVSWDTSAESNKVLMLEASLSLLDGDIADSLFIAGFYASCCAIAKKERLYSVCGIESIGENIAICNHLKEACATATALAPIVETPTAYFFYNFRHPTVNPRDIFILH